MMPRGAEKDTGESVSACVAITLGFDSWATGKTVEEVINNAEELKIRNLRITIHWPFSSEVSGPLKVGHQDSDPPDDPPHDSGAQKTLCTGTLLLVEGPLSEISKFDLLINLGPDFIT